MDGLKVYFEDMAGEVRRSPWLVSVVVLGVLLAMGACSGVMTDVRAGVAARLATERPGGRGRIFKKDARCLFASDEMTADDDRETL
jgi:hypothetical protein